MIKYELVENEGSPFYVLRTDEDGKIWGIPCDEANSDYQAYLNKDNPNWGKGTIS